MSGTAGNSDDRNEVIAPGAFDNCLPAEVPFTDKPGGERIGTAKVSKDETGVVVSITMPCGTITGNLTVEP